MSANPEANRTFHDLHRKGDPVILFNVWDPGSAATVAAAGAQAIATGSMPVAVAHGFSDGENIPLATALDNITRIVAAVDLPVTLDLEGGYVTSPAEVKATAQEAAATGVSGFNFEDQVVGGKGFYSISEQVARIAGVRAGADAVTEGLFLNARTDLFLKAKPEDHSAAMLDEAIERAGAYADAGADGFFAPGLADEALIARLCDSIALPVNIIALPHVPDTKTLSGLGVARISYGPVPYKKMSAWLMEQAKAAFSG